MYDPVTGRFTTPDPIGAHGDWNNLGNAYTYVGNNPGAYVDPIGLWRWDRDWVQTALEVMGFGVFSTRGRAVMSSFWMESGGSQLQAMRQGAGVILGGDLGLAKEQMITDVADLYERRIMMHYVTGAGTINDAILSASGWRMVGADLVGFTTLDEARTGLEYISGSNIGGAERVQRGLLGTSKLAASVAFISSTGTSLVQGYRGTGIPKIKLPSGEKVTRPIGELRSAGLKDSHHVIQNAAVRELACYKTNSAPGVLLRGPSTIKGTPHYNATQAQRIARGGNYGIERKIAYRSLREGGYSRFKAWRAIRETDRYFRGIGVKRNTPTRIPGNRR